MLVPVRNIIFCTVLVLINWEQVAGKCICSPWLGFFFLLSCRSTFRYCFYYTTLFNSLCFTGLFFFLPLSLVFGCSLLNRVPKMPSEALAVYYCRPVNSQLPRPEYRDELYTTGNLGRLTLLSWQESAGFYFTVH